MVPLTAQIQQDNQKYLQEIDQLRKILADFNRREQMQQQQHQFEAQDETPVKIPLLNNDLNQ